MVHPNSPLNIRGRLLLIQRLGSGMTQAQAAEMQGVSRATACKWSRRFLQEGVAGLEDRSSSDPESGRDLDGFVEFRERELLDELDRLVWSELDAHRDAGARGSVSFACCSHFLGAVGEPSHRLTALSRWSGRG